MWRRLRAAIGVSSPAERLEAACTRLREAPEILELPGRFSLFGLTRLPASYLHALTALAVGRDVHLFLLHPSPALWHTISERSERRAITTRSEDGTAALAANRLLASWGVDARELQLVLEATGPHTDHHHELDDSGPDTLLRRLQADIRADRPAPGVPPPHPARPPVAAYLRRSQRRGPRLPRTGAPGRGAPRGDPPPAGRRGIARAARRDRDVPRHRDVRAADPGDVRLAVRR